MWEVRSDQGQSPKPGIDRFARATAWLPNSVGGLLAKRNAVALRVEKAERKPPPDAVDEDKPGGGCSKMGETLREIGKIDRELR